MNEEELIALLNRFVEAAESQAESLDNMSRVLDSLVTDHFESANDGD